jgi:hypothetical protein
MIVPFFIWRNHIPRGERASSRARNKPFGVDVRNSREANININTLGLVFSVRFYFN